MKLQNIQMHKIQMLAVFASSPPYGQSGADGLGHSSGKLRRAFVLLADPVGQHEQTLPSDQAIIIPEIW